MAVYSLYRGPLLILSLLTITLAQDDPLKAMASAALGDWDRFFAVWSVRSVITDNPWVLFEPALDPVRKDPRFLRVLEQIGMKEAHARAQAWRAAHPPQKPAVN